MPRYRIAIDLADLVDLRERHVTSLAWEDEVEELPDGRFRVIRGDLPGAEGVLRFTPKLGRDQVLAPVDARPPAVLRVDFVDVQQGDAMVVEAPNGKLLLVDGGANQMFARYLATRFPGSSAQAPLAVDALVVTHGDGDHFVGLTEIAASERSRVPSKRLFLAPARVFHNGLAKRPGKTPDGKTRPEAAMFGATAEAADGGARLAIDLVDDLDRVADADLDAHFLRWKRAIAAWRRRGPVAVKRLERGAGDLGFLAASGLDVRVLGPLTDPDVQGRPGLRLLGDPPARAARVVPRAAACSASQTINGHSVILQLTFGGFRFLLSGDLNETASARLVEAGGLRAEVLKVPHHGSADFSLPFLKAVSPVISVVSSGDESTRMEYIHPRATLLGALGRASRPELDEPLVFVTELAAFMKLEGWVVNDPARLTHPRQRCGRMDEFLAFSRSAYGIVRIRTDGQRLVVFTYSGKQGMREAYAYTLDGERVAPAAVRVLSMGRLPRAEPDLLSFSRAPKASPPRRKAAGARARRAAPARRGERR